MRDDERIESLVADIQKLLDEKYNEGFMDGSGPPKETPTEREYREGSERAKVRLNYLKKGGTWGVADPKDYLAGYRDALLTMGLDLEGE